MATASFECLDHVGAPVWDADAAAAFYRQIGVPLIHDEEHDSYPIRAVFFDFDGIYLEFLEPTGPGNVKTYLERHGPGYQHVAYRVEDLDEMMTALREDGITFQSDDPLPGIGDCQIVFIEERHTAGLQVELVERFSAL